jgi:dihydroorotate dehydrogenase
VITLPNGHRFEFVAAAGALGYDGRGYPWEWPFRWAGLLRPRAFTVITKTLTLAPRRGNLRWYAPWRAVRRLGGGNTVNAVGLTNPGLKWWVKRPRTTAWRHGVKVIVSVWLEGVWKDEVRAMIDLLNDAYYDAPSPVVAAELNMSCPNAAGGVSDRRRLEIVRVLRRELRCPLVIKLPHEGAADLCHRLTSDGCADAFDLGQSVPWDFGYPGKRSPLLRYGYAGAISGPYIKPTARRTLEWVRDVTRTPLISGGGIDSLEEANYRFGLGADAVAFGTLFLYKPWAPNRIVKALSRPAPTPTYPAAGG